MIGKYSLVIEFSSKEESVSDNDSNNNGEKSNDDALHNLSEEKNELQNDEIDKKNKNKRKKKEVKSDDDVEYDNDNDNNTNDDNDKEPKVVYAPYFNPPLEAKKGMGFIFSNALLSPVSLSYGCFCLHL